MNIELIPAYDRVEDVRALFSEYTAMLVEGEPLFQGYLDKQHYDDELEHLEEKYGTPHGRLYLAIVDGSVAGCIGLRRIDDGFCELKRLYVRPAFRGMHLGGMLVQRIFEDARAIGYGAILLDTLPFLETAIGMYRKYGFYEIPSYNNSPMDNLVYMRRDLHENKEEA